VVQLRVELRYADDLRLCVKKQWIGIDPVVLDTRKSGPFRLQGMKERSARVRPRLNISSSSNRGTEIAVKIPGVVAFLPQ